MQTESQASKHWQRSKRKARHLAANEEAKHKQANKQASKQTIKQTSKQANSQPTNQPTNQPTSQPTKQTNKTDRNTNKTNKQTKLRGIPAPHAGCQHLPCVFGASRQQILWEHLGDLEAVKERLGKTLKQARFTPSLFEGGTSGSYIHNRRLNFPKLDPTRKPLCSTTKPLSLTVSGSLKPTWGCDGERRVAVQKIPSKHKGWQRPADP